MSDVEYDDQQLQLALDWAAESAAHYPSILRAEVCKLQDRVAKLENYREPTGVWQVELTNGRVHNFVADRVSGAGTGIFMDVSAGHLEFVRDTPTGRSYTVLAVRPELVMSYRRLADWDGTANDPQQYEATRFAGPVHQVRPTPNNNDWLKTTTKP